jgi:hypothetical protein
LSDELGTTRNLSAPPSYVKAFTNAEAAGSVCVSNHDKNAVGHDGTSLDDLMNKKKGTRD